MAIIWLRHIVPWRDAVADLLELSGLTDVLLEHLLDLVETQLLASAHPIGQLLLLCYSAAEGLLITDDMLVE